MCDEGTNSQHNRHLKFGQRKKRKREEVWLRESERDREKETLVFKQFRKFSEQFKQFISPSLPSFTNMQLTHMQRWDTEFVEDWVFCSPVGMVEWFLVLQKRKKFLVFSIEVAPQLKTLVLTVRSVQVGVLILFVLCLKFGY